MEHRVALVFALLAACRPPESSGPADPQLQRRTSELAAAVSAEGFAVDLSGVRIEPVDGDAWVERVAAELERSHPRGYWDAMAALRSALAITTGTGDAVRGELARARAHAQLALYDAEHATIVIDADADANEWLDRDLVRALGRAYQHRAFVGAAGTSTDARAAHRCLLDGHADVLAFVIVVGRPLAAVDDAWFGPIGTPVAGEVEVSCAAGSRVLAAQARTGGWPAALRAIESPPPSTEQLLHSGKRGVDQPLSIELPQWPRAAGPAELVFDDTLGELAIARLLRERGLRAAQAWRAAIGWDGDRLRVHALASGERVVVWRSVWDREADARQFVRALAGARLEVSREGRVVDAIAGGSARTRAAIEAELSRARSVPDGDPGDEGTAAEAEAMGVIVD